MLVPAMTYGVAVILGQLPVVTFAAGAGRAQKIKSAMLKNVTAADPAKTIGFIVKPQSSRCQANGGQQN